MTALTNILKNSTFGVELELCACMYELFSTLFKIKTLTKLSKPIPKKLKTKWENLLKRLTTPLEEEMGFYGYKDIFLRLIQTDKKEGDNLGLSRDDLESIYYNLILSNKDCDEKFVSENDDEYSTWVITKDDSILCGIKELSDKKFSLSAYEEFKDEVKNSSTGIILPKNNKEYIEKFKNICENNMIGIEIISKKYLYSNLSNFLNTLDNCVFHEDVIYEINTSQGLHISIGNELIHKLNDNGIIDWLSNLINLWYKFEKQIFKLIPLFRHNNRFAKPVNSIFKNKNQLNKINKKNKYNKKSNKYNYPEWLLFYARNIDTFGSVEDDDRPKFTSINIKGLSFDQSSPDPNRISIDKNPYIEYRLVSSGSDTKLISNWITFLTYFSTIAFHEKYWNNAMNTDKLSDIFPPSLKNGKKILRYLEDNVDSNILYKIK